MGSQSTTHFAYIAGFLDGDGSLMLQVKKRKDGNLGHRFMVTICFYQDSRHEQPLMWIQKRIKIGYISRRNDGITELRINGFQQVARILKKLLPYIRFKKIQARAIYKAAILLSQKGELRLIPREKRYLVDLILSVQQQNYVTRRKKTKDELYEVLGLTP
ncbi:MAG: LAGLIDADG family homing endonuclease [Patescibacteria group bacterium]